MKASDDVGEVWNVDEATVTKLMSQEDVDRARLEFACEGTSERLCFVDELVCGHLSVIRYRFDAAWRESRMTQLDLVAVPDVDASRVVLETERRRENVEALQSRASEVDEERGFLFAFSQSRLGGRLELANAARDRHIELAGEGLLRRTPSADPVA